MQKHHETGFAIILAVILIMMITLAFLCSCKTTKSSLSLHGERETASQSSNRLSSVLRSDSIAQWLSMNADSLIITFADGELDFFLPMVTSYPSPTHGAGDGDVTNGKNIAEAQTRAAAQPPSKGGGAHTAQSKPKAIKIYGLHINANAEEKSVVNSSSADSTATAMQSEKIEEDIVKKSSPNFTARLLYILAVMAVAAIIYLCLRRTK